MSEITETAQPAMGDLANAKVGSDPDRSKESVSEAIQPATEITKIRLRRSGDRSQKQASHRKVGEVGSAKATHAQDLTSAQVLKKPSKQDILLDLLRRNDGATIDELIDVTSWQGHSVRGFLSGTVRKKLMLNLISDVVGNGVRRYRVAPDGGNDAASEAGQSLPGLRSSEHPVTGSTSSEQVD